MFLNVLIFVAVFVVSAFVALVIGGVVVARSPRGYFRQRGGKSSVISNDIRIEAPIVWKGKR